MPADPGTRRQTTGSLLLDRTVVLDGYLEFAGEVVIEGSVAGEVWARRIVVAAGAEVSGMLVAEAVEIAGVGHDVVVFADRLALLGGCRVTGELYHALLDLAPDAWFDGKSRRHPDPRSLPAGEPGEP